MNIVKREKYNYKTTNTQTYLRLLKYSPDTNRYRIQGVFSTSITPEKLEALQKIKFRGEASLVENIEKLLIEKFNGVKLSNTDKPDAETYILDLAIKNNAVERIINRTKDSSAEAKKKLEFTIVDLEDHDALRKKFPDIYVEYDFICGIHRPPFYDVSTDPFELEEMSVEDLAGLSQTHNLPFSKDLTKKQNLVNMVRCLKSKRKLFEAKYLTQISRISKQPTLEYPEKYKALLNQNTHLLKYRKGDRETPEIIRSYCINRNILKCKHILKSYKDHQRRLKKAAVVNEPVEEEQSNNPAIIESEASPEAEEDDDAEPIDPEAVYDENEECHGDLYAVDPPEVEGEVSGEVEDEVESAEVPKKYTKQTKKVTLKSGMLDKDMETDIKLIKDQLKAKADKDTSKGMLMSNGDVLHQMAMKIYGNRLVEQRKKERESEHESSNSSNSSNLSNLTIMITKLKKYPTISDDIKNTFGNGLTYKSMDVYEAYTRFVDVFTAKLQSQWSLIGECTYFGFDPEKKHFLAIFDVELMPDDEIINEMYSNNRSVYTKVYFDNGKVYNTGVEQSFITSEDTFDYFKKNFPNAVTIYNE
uniref:Uncharacterized protein n=1 Tax=viral metagenome TaxID=1070528 RepID=A0A6C0CJS4_9ZZZZ